ncbi:putative T7SS-secreted protein [Streptomyces bungoensis]
MGLGDITNSLLGGAEHLYDEGKKKLGEAVDYGTDKLGGALDHVGAHDWADSVEDWGDEVASDLGATPGEHQLGQTEEPNELIHGSPEKIRESAKHLKDFHGAFDKVSQGLRKVDSSGWQGEGGDAFREKFGVHPTKWAQAAEACTAAAGALESYADTVKWAQGQAKEAVELYKKGVKAAKAAADDYRTKAEAYDAKARAGDDPGPKPKQDMEAGKADVKAAVQKLAEARKQRNTAGSQAQGKVRAALAHAPAEPPPLSRIGNDLVDGYQAVNTELTHVVGGALKGTAGLLNFVRGLNPTDPYNLTHPAAYLQNVSMTLSGLVSTAAHPERVVQAAVDGFKKDPSEFVGRLIPELIGTKGAGLARGGLRLGLKTAAKEGLEEGAESTARRALRDTQHGASPDGANRVARPQHAVESTGSDPIDLATGRMYLPQTDVTLPGAMPLKFTRRLESGYRLGKWFGPSWSSTVDQRLDIDAEGVLFVTADGLLLNYPHPAPGVPTLPSHGPRRPLDRVEAGYTVTDPVTGRVWHFADRGERLAVLEQIDDRNGNWLAFEHSPDGAPTAIVSSGGYRLRLTTRDGRITALYLTGGAPEGTDQEIKRYGYTADGHLAEVADSSGRALRFGYDERGRVTSWTDSNGHSYAYEYDDRDRCVAEGGSAGHMTLCLSYGPLDEATGNRVTETTTGDGHTRRFLFNGAHQVIAETDPLGHTTTYSWDRHNRLLSSTDPLGHSTTYRYDDHGNLSSVTRPDGQETTARYNDLGLPVQVRGTDGNTIRHTYDERGNRTSTTDSTGRTSVFTHDGAGRLTSITDPLGNTTTLRCDRAGLPVEITDPLGATTRIVRDAFGRPAETTDPTGAVTRLEWTVEGRLARRFHPDGTCESWTWDGEGNCVSHTDRIGGVTRFEYTHFDLLAARTTPDGVRHEFRHDAELRLTQVANPQGLTWRYAFDAAGNLVSERDFDGRELTYTHDAAGRLVSRTNALGETTVFERDELGRIVRKDAAGQVTSYAYDLTDQLAQATGPDGVTLTLLRDRHGHLLSEAVDGKEMRYTYDEMGRRTSRTTPTGATTTWSYDAAGHRTGMTASGRTLDFQYDAAGRELSLRVADAVTVSRSFDELGRVTAQTVTGPDGARVRHRDYHYRGDGHLFAVEGGPCGPRQFSLDAVGRVVAVDAADWTETYAYDEAGNQTFASWPATHPGYEATGERAYEGTRVTQAGSLRYAYDRLGRITLRQKTRLSRKADSWRYEWDTENRLASVTTPDGARWRYTYDPLGRRTAKLRLADDDTTVVERVDFTWDGNTLCEQTTMAPGLPHPVTLTWDHQGLRPVAQTERILGAAQEEIDSRFFAIVTDVVGSPSELVDENGDIAWCSRSTLWGRTAWAANSTAYTPLRFPGQYADPETGLHYNYFRHYDPETARYVTPDPLGLAPAPNPSTYVTNPQTLTDHLGLAPDYVAIYRTPKGAQAEYELNNGPNPANHQPGVDIGGGIISNGKIYFGERGVAAEYAGPSGRNFAKGMVKYEMHPSFLEEFGEHAKIHDYNGPNGAPRLEFEIPVEKLDRFNELTQGRSWISIFGDPK